MRDEGGNYTVDATTLRRNLSDVLGKVEFAGARFKVTKNGKVIAVIGPPSNGKLETPPVKDQKERK
jgi:prevent-host-death family protein